MSERDWNAYLEEAKVGVERLTGNLPRAVDPLSFDTRCKTPYVLLCVREGQYYRGEEFARNAYECFRGGDNVVGVANTRSFTESVAVIFYIRNLMEDCIKNGASSGLHDLAVRLMVGCKNDEALPKAINILTMLEKVETEIPGFRTRYDRMSEFVHPNWSGAAGVFARRDPKTLITWFGRNLRGNPYAAQMGLLSLCGALGIFGYAYNKITDMMPAFSAACEESLPPRDDNE